jgi:hypothetical protein
MFIRLSLLSQAAFLEADFTIPSGNKVDRISYEKSECGSYLRECSRIRGLLADDGQTGINPGQKSASGKFAEIDTDECFKADKSQGRFRRIIDF